MSWISPRLVPCRQGSVERAGAYRLEHYNIELLARSRSSSPSDRSGDRPGQTSQTGWRLWRAQRLRRAASQTPSREGVCWGEAVRRTPFDSSSTVRLTRRVHEVTLGAAPHRRRHLHRRAKRGFSKNYVRRSGCLCNLARGCKLAHRPQRLPEQLDHAESIALVRGRPFVSSWVELVIAQSVTADRHFFRSCEQHSLNRPPDAPYCAGFARISSQKSRQK